MHAMIDPSIAGFYDKNAGDEYAATYRQDHSPRIRAMVERYGLKEKLAGKRLVDVGGGLGFAGEWLDPTTDYWVIDGAEFRPEQRVCKGSWLRADLDHDRFGEPVAGIFDAAFCLETLEHCTNPYNCIEQIKRLVRSDGDIFLSVPTESVTHNTPYPSLFWPYQNFVQWLGQMALPVEDGYVYKPKGRGWPAYQYKCRNANWTEARMLFPKPDPKFQGKTPQEYANL